MVEVEKKTEEQGAAIELPKLGKNSKCRGRYALVAADPAQADQKVLLPLKSVSVKSELRGAYASTEVELTYFNPSATSPLECTYTFPIEKSTTVAKFEASIDDRIIETKIQDKQQAQEKYEDAVGGGKAAVMAERSKKDELMTVKLGNLLPGQQATLKSTILTQLEVVGGNYYHSVPPAYFPDYKKYGVKDKEAYAYTFSYEVRIVSDTRIANVSMPANAQLVEQNDEKTNILMRCDQPGRSVDLFYRTADMLIPQLIYAQNPDTNEVAVQASLVPTFDPVQPQDFFEVVEDEKPEQIKLSGGSEFHFIFVVDRSGSMGCLNRMQLAIDAMNIFIRSLPVGCKFSIISFGSNFDNLNIEGQDSIKYSDNSKESALSSIAQFSCNYGGTDILQPLRAAQTSFQSDLKKRVFLLTDGSVGSPDQVVMQAREHNSKTRVYSFGLGSGCDRNLVTKVAQAGRGTSTIVKDNDPNLNGLVIKALSAAMEPSLQDVEYGFNGTLSSPEELYRNIMVSESALMSQEEFDKLTFDFKAKASEHKEALDLKFTKADFRRVEGKAAKDLFKIAAQAAIDKAEGNETKQKELSLKHQVLCDQTAIVGVMKQTDKATGELQESTIEFGKEAQPEQQDQFGGFGVYGGGAMVQMARAPMRKMAKAAHQPQMMMAMAQPMMAPPPMACGMAPQQQPMMGMAMAQQQPMMGMAMAQQQPMMGMAMAQQQPMMAPQQERRSRRAPMMRQASPDMMMKKSKRRGASPEEDMLEMACEDQAMDLSESFQPAMKSKAMVKECEDAEEEDDDSECEEESKATPVLRSESAMPSAPAKAAAPAKEKPEFKAFIGGATSDGSWGAKSRALLAACVDGESIDDDAVRSALGALTLTADNETVYLTLLAWYVLEEAYGDFEDEWQLIADKAKTWLEQVGVAKPYNLVKQFSLTLRD